MQCRSSTIQATTRTLGGLPKGPVASHPASNRVDAYILLAVVAGSLGSSPNSPDKVASIRFARWLWTKSSCVKMSGAWGWFGCLSSGTMEDRDSLLIKSGNTTSPKAEQSRQASPPTPAAVGAASGHADDAARSRLSRRENVVNEGARVGHAKVLSWLQATDPAELSHAGEAPGTVRMEVIK